MIPFARIMKYGNKLQTRKVIKISAGLTGWVMLMDNGDLYCYGNGPMGDGKNEFRSEWTFINSNVRNFWVDPINVFIVVQKDDNTVEYCGDQRYITGLTNQPIILNFTVDSMFASKTTRVKDIKFNTTQYSVGLITSTGVFYLRGSQRALNGGTSPLSSWTQFNTGIIALASSSTNWWTINSVGNVMGGGQNISQIFNNSAENTFVSYPTSIGTTANVDDTNLLSGQYWVSFNSSANKNSYYGRGFNSNGQFGNGTTTTLRATTIISSSWPNLGSMKNTGASNYDTITCIMYYTTGGLIYYSGYSAYRVPGVAAGKNTMTAFTVPFDVNLIEYLYLDRQSTYAFLSDGRIFMIGRYFNSAGLQENTDYTDVTSMFGAFEKAYTRETMINGRNV
jgi:hypothetical protein